MDLYPFDTIFFKTKDAQSDQGVEKEEKNQEKAYIKFPKEKEIHFADSPIPKFDIIPEVVV
jgi:hypothetical protein